MTTMMPRLSSYEPPSRTDPVGAVKPPAGDLSIADNDAPNTLTEDSAATWARWSEDRAERERAQRIEATAETALDKAVYARETAEAIADDAAKLIPDWRLLRPEVAAAFTRIVRRSAVVSWKGALERRFGHMI